MFGYNNTNQITEQFEFCLLIGSYCWCSTAAIMSKSCKNASSNPLYIYINCILLGALTYVANYEWTQFA